MAALGDPDDAGPVWPAWLDGFMRLLLVACLALSAYLLWRTAVLTPYSDELGWVERWRRLQAEGGWASYLLTPVNLHRIPWTFGLVAWDIQAFGGTNAPLIVSGAISLGLMAWMLVREAAGATPPPLALPAAVLAALLALTPANVLDASTPICVNYTHGAALAVMAMLLAEGRDRSGLDGRRLLALSAAICAALGDAVALAVWPVLAIGALRRRDWRWLAAVLIVGAGFIGLYASGQDADGIRSAQHSLGDPLGALRLALNYLTLPWTRLNVELAWIGGLAVGLLATLAIALHGGPGATRNQRIACAFILFSLVTAAMAGLGRLDQPQPLNVPLRYAILLAPMHVGLLTLALPGLGRAWTSRPRIAQAVLATALLGLAIQDMVMAAKVVKASDTVRHALSDFEAGRRTPEMLVFVDSDFAYAEAAYAKLRREGLFQHELHLREDRAKR